MSAYTYWNDLQVLNNILNKFKQPPVVEFNNTRENDDLKETIDILIDEFVFSNFKEYKATRNTK